jgi:hypothetical protein
MVVRWIVLSLVATLAAGVYAVYVGALAVPARYNPWAPLDVEAAPDWLTDIRLARTRRDPALCAAALARTGMRYDAVPDRETAPGCGFSHAVRLHGAPVRLGSASLTLSCPMALSFYMWERHALQPAAEARYGQRVAGIEQLGSYACRNVNTGDVAPGSSRSRHATADALDALAREGRRSRRGVGAHGCVAAARRPPGRVPVLRRRARPRLQRGASRPLPPRDGRLRDVPLSPRSPQGDGVREDQHLRRAFPRRSLWRGRLSGNPSFSSGRPHGDSRICLSA